MSCYPNGGAGAELRGLIERADGVKIQGGGSAWRGSGRPRGPRSNRQRRRSDFCGNVSGSVPSIFSACHNGLLSYLCEEHSLIDSLYSLLTARFILAHWVLNMPY